MATRKNGTAIEVKRYKYLDWKIAGMTYREIAKQFHTPPSTVHSHVQKALKELAAEHSDEADHLRNIQNTRYNTLLARHWGPALQGDRDALNSVLKIMDNINKINGLEQRGIEIDQKITNFTFKIDRTNIDDNSDISSDIHSALPISETEGRNIHES